MVVSVDDVLGESSPLARRLASYERRDGQLAMARAVLEALAQDRHLFVEAGTGTGKTLAYLVPAVLSGRRVVVSTATHALEEQIFYKDLPLVQEALADHGVVVHAALMKGLANYVCKRRLDERLRGGEPVSADLARLERWALETATGDRAEAGFLEEGAAAWRDVQSGTETRIGAGCKHYESCFVTRMRRAAEEASIVVVNHHLFFADLALKSGKGGAYAGAIPAYDAVIFDEAHQIEGVATDFFGVRVSTHRAASLVRDARRAVFGARALDASSMRLVDEVEAAAVAFFRSWVGGGDDARRPVLPSDWTATRAGVHARFDAALEALWAFATARDADDALAAVSRRAADLRADVACVRARGELPSAAPAEHGEKVAGYAGAVVWAHARDRDVALGASPVDVAPLLRERLFERVPSVICTSATLATATHAGPSFHFARARLGAPPETEELVVASPFDFETRALFYVARDLPEPSDPRHEELAADRVAELVRVTSGGAFVLCTSTRAMRALRARLARLLSTPLFVQGEAPKHLLLDRFRASGSAVLVATMSFWEGVDVPGHALRLVVIDKIPFAVPTDPVVAARCGRIEAEGGNPFSEYSVPSAAITLKQGFGRLIRTSRDVGVVALLDARAVRRGYGRALLASLPPARRVTTLDDVREFWASRGAGDAPAS